MIIVLGNDHAAVDMKFKIKEYIESLGHKVINVGIDVNEKCDYPDIAYKACKEIVNKKADLGVLICGTGLGMSIAANKVKGIRAVACVETFGARMAREHNDANVLCFGERVVGIETAKCLVKSFLEGKFAGTHHVVRVDKIMAIENGTYKG